MMPRIQNIEASVSPISRELVVRAERTQAVVDGTSNAVEDLRLQMAQMNQTATYIASSLQQNNAVLANHSQITQTGLTKLEETTLQIYRQLGSNPRLLGELTHEDFLSTRLQPWSYGRDTMNLHQSIQLCSCRRIWSHSQKSLLGVHFRWDKYQEHYSSCPFHQNTRKSWKLGFQVMLSRSLRRAVEILMTAKVQAGRFKLYPIIESTRVVNRATSPAFALFQIEALKDNQKIYDLLAGMHPFRPVLFNWDEGLAIAMEDFLDKIFESLIRLFSLGKASARDKDERGLTLLHVSLLPSSVHGMTLILTTS